MKKDISKKALGIILISIAALFSSVGQLAWKFGTDGSTALLLYLLGFLLAGIGMIIMMISFRFGEISILQPIMAIGFVFSIFLGRFFLDEPITAPKVIGTIFIIIGIVLLNYKSSSSGVKS